MKELIKIFYISFQNLDAEAMIACYHDDIVFEDPAFGVLKGDKAKNMWRMLCKNGVDLNIIYSNINIHGTKGKAYWEAQYTFGRTARKIHNKVQASFEFQDGKIIKHKDHFSLHTWAKQALGVKGLLLGGTSYFKKKLNKQTNRLLEIFEKTLTYE